MQAEFISLVGNANSLQSLIGATWIVNKMKTIQFFDGYRSNTYLVDSRNLQNADLLNEISKSNIFGCYFDVRTIDGSMKINQLVVACSQGVVIFNSIEKESNEVMKKFFTTISNKQCYARGITPYYKFINLYSLNINKMKNVETNECYTDFIEFRKQLPFCNFSENYRSQSKLQQTDNSVIDCLVNAFEAACIDYYFSNNIKKRNSLNVPNFSPEIRAQPSFPPGISIPQNLDYPPGLGPQPRPLSPKSFAQRHSIDPQKTYNKYIYAPPPPNNNSNNDKPKPKPKPKESTTFGPISVDILKSNEKKQSEINKQFWKNLETLIAILSSTKKIEVENGKYFCKTCNKNFVSYEFLLEHCWDEHKSALE